MANKPKWHKRANPGTASFVAGNAKKGQPNRKQAKRLTTRLNDYAAMMADNKDPTMRKGSGGYHKPGSMQ